MTTDSKKLNDIIGFCGAMQTLIDNFPMSVFSVKGKTYTSAIDFILDILRQIGLDEITLTDEIIKLFFNVPNAIEIYGNMGTLVYKSIKKPTDEQIKNAENRTSVPTDVSIDDPDYIVVDNVYYFKTTKVSHDVQSEFVNGLEDSVKNIIMNILTAILSCSIVPEIPDYDLDLSEQYRIELPLSLIDTCNYLNICPTTEIGQNFYNVDYNTTPNTLYKSKDLNAFIWYVLNRGTTINQTEINKMMWDSRMKAENYSDYNRNIPEQWNSWLSSKTGSTTTNPDNILYASGKTNEYFNALEDSEGKNTTTQIPLHPIIQFYPNNSVTGEKTLNLLISSQSYWQPNRTFNKSIYEFNKDYLENIKIFSPRVLVASMINELLNGNVLGSLGLSYSIEENYIDAQINEIIKRALEDDDMTISDCYFTFSNDEYNKMLSNMEIQRYGGKILNSETSPIIKIEKDFGIEKLNEINSMATINEKISTITKTIYDIAAIPGTDASIEISDKSSLGYNNEWLRQILMSIIRPIVKSLLSPKLMLLFLIDFEIMGLINLEDVNAIKNINDILNIFYRKIFGAMISVIKYIKDKIIEFLLNLFFKHIEQLLNMFYAFLLNERLDAWIALLAEAAICLPRFKQQKVLTEIDDVNYADITKTSDVPESSVTC